MKFRDFKIGDKFYSNKNFWQKTTNHQAALLDDDGSLHIFKNHHIVEEFSRSSHVQEIREDDRYKNICSGCGYECCACYDDQQGYGGWGGPW
jgi:hypothetical protein